jgi:hypothetical protein
LELESVSKNNIASQSRNESVKEWFVVFPSFKHFHIVLLPQLSIFILSLTFSDLSFLASIQVIFLDFLDYSSWGPPPRLQNLYLPGVQMTALFQLRQI